MSEETVIDLGTTDAKLAVAQIGEHIHIVGKESTSTQIYHHIFNVFTKEVTSKAIPNATTKSGVSMTVVGQKIYAVFQAVDERKYICQMEYSFSYDPNHPDGKWSSPVFIKEDPEWKTITTPTIASNGATCYIMWGDPNWSFTIANFHTETKEYNILSTNATGEDLPLACFGVGLQVVMDQEKSPEQRLVYFAYGLYNSTYTRCMCYDPIKKKFVGAAETHACYTKTDVDLIQLDSNTLACYQHAAGKGQTEINRVLLHIQADGQNKWDDSFTTLPGIKALVGPSSLVFGNDIYVFYADAETKKIRFATFALQ